MQLLSILLFLGIVYGISGFALSISKLKKDGKELQLPASKLTGILSVILLILWNLIIRIGPQEVGVVVTPNGVKDQELTTGWHFVPWWNDVHKMDKTEWVYTFSESAGEGAKSVSDAIWAPTKDGIKMGFDISVTWKILPNEASWIYENISDEGGRTHGRYHWIEENIIRAKTKSALALTASRFTPIEVYSTERENIQQLVFERLKTDLEQKRLQIIQVDIREVFYNTEYEQAINAKKLAEQEVLRLEQVTKQDLEKLKQARIQKDIKLALAKGEAEALKIKGESISKNPKIIELKRIEKWDGKYPHTLITGKDGAGILLNMNAN